MIAFTRTVAAIACPNSIPNLRCLRSVLGTILTIVLLMKCMFFKLTTFFSQRYRDSKTDKLYKVRLAFEACVKPGSYNVGPQTLDTSGEHVDPKLDIREIEWATKERGSVEIYGLLIKLEPAF